MVLFWSVALVLGYLTLRVEAAHTAVDPVGDSRGLVGRLVEATTAVGFYLRQFIHASVLLPVYPRWSLDGARPAAMICGALAAAALGLMWANRQGWGRHALLGTGFFLLTLFPVLGFVRMDYMNISWVADHFVDLPMLGLVGLVACGLEAGYRRGPGWARPLIVLGTAVGCCYLAREAHRDARHWSSAENLWTHTLEHNPDCWLAQCALALALRDDPGRTNEAIALYESALRLKPDFIEAHNDLGTALAGLPGRTDEAIAQFAEALRLKPDFAVAHFNLAGVLATMPERRRDAIAEYAEAVRCKPYFFEARFSLAVALSSEPGRRDDAIAQYREALLVNPQSAEARTNLGQLLIADPRRLDEAVSQFAQAVRLHPRSAEAHFNLGFALERVPRRLEDAVAQYQQALRL